MTNLISRPSIGWPQIILGLLLVIVLGLNDVALMELSQSTLDLLGHIALMLFVSGILQRHSRLLLRMFKNGFPSKNFSTR
jgi:uncharacterized membrane protein HdeD (DUF308 family)